MREDGDGLMVVHGLAVSQVGDLAFENAVRLHELAPAQASLEQAFMELTASSVRVPRRTGRAARDRRAGSRGRGGLT